MSADAREQRRARHLAIEQSVRTWRWVRTAETWVGKAGAAIREQHERARDKSGRWRAGYEAANLVRALLEETAELAAFVGDDYVEECEQLARDLAHVLRRRRLAAALANTEGRTPEEAAAFRAKAADLSR